MMIMWNIINKIGFDKVLHLLFGALITFIIGNASALQEGVLAWGFLAMTLIGIIVTLILEFMKEFIIDDTPDWKDILATFLGCLVPVIANLFGSILYVLSN